jgi:hypothetical protein
LFAAVKVAVAVPFAPVVPDVTVKPPEVAVKATVAPETVLLFASSTSAVIVAD